MFVDASLGNMCTHIHVSTKAKDVRSLGVGVTGSCESADWGLRTETCPSMSQLVMDGIWQTEHGH